MSSSAESLREEPDRYHLPLTFFGNNFDILSSQTASQGVILYLRINCYKTLAYPRYLDLQAFSRVSTLESDLSIGEVPLLSFEGRGIP